MDLSEVENCKELHKKVKDVDILINNAGFGDCGNFSKTSLEKEISMINTNIIAYHTLMKLYLIDMLLLYETLHSPLYQSLFLLVLGIIY
mgnify:CR=1 FL=1